MFHTDTAPEPFDSPRPVSPKNAANKQRTNEKKKNQTNNNIVDIFTIIKTIIFLNSFIPTIQGANFGGFQRRHRRG